MSDLDLEEYQATRKIYYDKDKRKFYKDKMSIEQAMKILEHKSDYLVPNSDIDEALDTLIEYLKKFNGER